MKKFSLLGLVLIIGLFASCTPTVGHICTVFEENIVKTATCTENGSKTIVCVECGTEKVETIPALGHNFDTLVTEATCTENGSKKCSRCETTVEIDKVPHTKGNFHHGVFDKDTDGSFINTTYYKCSKCITHELFDTNEPWFIPLTKDSSIYKAFVTYTDMVIAYKDEINDSNKIYYEDSLIIPGYSNFYNKEMKFIFEDWQN